MVRSTATCHEGKESIVRTTTTSEQQRVGGIDDGVYLQGRDAAGKERQLLVEERVGFEAPSARAFELHWRCA